MIRIDMEMPKNCTLCPLQVLDADGHHTCAPDTKSRDVDIEIINGTKAAFCPLLNVPDINDGEWISVKDRTPHNHDCVLVYSSEEGVEMVCYKCYGTLGKWVGPDGFVENVSHWMPLPEKPEAN